MWNKIDNYDYSVVPEGKVKLRVAPAIDPDASLLKLDAECTHYTFFGKTQARFELDNGGAGLYYLDLADYVIMFWSND